MSVLESPEELREYTIHRRSVEERKRGYNFSFAEKRLWDLSIAAPFGSKVILTNDNVYNPYLMRVYLAPEKAKVSNFLVQSLGMPAGVTKLVDESYRPFLHFFFRGDDDREYHNHPFRDSYSLVLGPGGYIDHRWDFLAKQSYSRLVKPGRINVIRRNDFHRVELLHGFGCWTLFFAGKRMHPKDGTDWDFYSPETEEFVPWGKWTSGRSAPHGFSRRRDNSRAVDQAQN